MKKIKISEWGEMSEQDKANFLLSGDFYVKKIIGIPVNSKVGDSTVVNSFIGYVSSIGITKHCSSLIECLEESVSYLKSCEE